MVLLCQLLQCSTYSQALHQSVHFLYAVSRLQQDLLTLRHPDHEALQPAAGFQPKQYAKPDGQVSFDMTTSLYRSGTNHEHDQPSHLRLRNKGVPTAVNLPIYAGPESRYCPAGMGHNDV